MNKIYYKVYYILYVCKIVRVNSMLDKINILLYNKLYNKNIKLLSTETIHTKYKNIISAYTELDRINSFDGMIELIMMSPTKNVSREYSSITMSNWISDDSKYHIDNVNEEIYKLLVSSSMFVKKHRNYLNYNNKYTVANLTHTQPHIILLESIINTLFKIHTFKEW